MRHTMRWLVSALGAAPALACGTSGPTGPSGPAVVQVTSGSFYTCAVRANGAAYCWGENGNGQLGVGDAVQRTRPTPVSGALDWATVSAGDSHACGVSRGAGAVYCWGMNSSGDLGSTTGTVQLAPEAVAGTSGFSTVSAGTFHTCGLKGAQAYCWGFNLDGELGTGTTTSQSPPTPVAQGPGGVITALSAGVIHTCALGALPETAAVCWGGNFDGVLGDSGTAASDVPMGVRGGAAFVQVSVGGYSSCAVTAAGAAYCWGLNTGSGDATARNYPVPVAGGLVFAMVSVGSSHSCGVTTSHAAYCWGTNDSGELGDGTTTTHLVPVAVAGGLSFTMVSVGVSHTCGVTASGGVTCWGDNSSGELGDGTTVNHSAPAPVIL